MRARRRRALRWFHERWEPLGYTAEYATNGHYKVRDPEGRYVATISATPRNPKSPEFEGERVLRRYHESRSTS
jgi:hypothetical protein